MALVVDFIGVRVALESTNLFFCRCRVDTALRDLKVGFPAKMGEGINVFNSSSDEEEALTCLDPKKKNVVKRYLIYCVVKADHRQCALSIRTTIPVLLILFFICYRAPLRD